jgi:hypothetical protein
MHTKHECNAHCHTLASLWLIKSEAERKAMKYRRDPFLHEVHQQYAEALEAVFQAGKEAAHV